MLGKASVDEIRTNEITIFEDRQEKLRTGMRDGRALCDGLRFRCLGTSMPPTVSVGAHVGAVRLRRPPPHNEEAVWLNG